MSASLIATGYPRTGRRAKHSVTNCRDTSNERQHRQLRRWRMADERAAYKRDQTGVRTARWAAHSVGQPPATSNLVDAQGR